MLPIMLDISSLQALYRSGGATPVDVIDEVLRRIANSTDSAIWISRLPDSEILAAAQALIGEGGDPASKPLWGIPFAVKDNIDCAGLDTTAACREFAYRPAADAHVIARLKAAGAILIGKTNLDQFATGLNGTRSPYGAPRCVFDSSYISGGSSSGSAVAVAAGLVAFAMGTDTAGSGRVPAAFNNIVGIKPSRGLLSNHGLVRACRSLDCITVLAATCADGDLVRRTGEGPDAADPYSRHAIPRALPQANFRFGILAKPDREFFGDWQAEALYAESIERMRGLGGIAVVIDFAPFREAAALLYAGPWAAERLAAIGEFLRAQGDAVEPTVRHIIEGAHAISGVDCFRGQYRLQELKRLADTEWTKVDLLFLPTAPTQYTVDEVLADSIVLNSRLGHYTNFVNLLDLCAVAVPAGFKRNGLPFGVTVMAPAFHDAALAALADRFHREIACGTGIAVDAPIPGAPLPHSETTSEKVLLAVVGAHLSGMPLNHQLTNAGGTLVRQCRTHAEYRAYALPNTVPPKPGLVREPGFQGPGIEIEVWALDAAVFGQFVAAIPAPLGIGKITLEDGTQVSGFLSEAHAVEGAEEITQFGGWRAYIASKS